ncbi:ketopantoate reductase family protein [Paraburkholderia sp. SOS3]|uniref:ketopantoate reductase family protein n=1 Tax=Paraburkholderia sp. SOS3 TaxID=1926494 RepID=UPI0009477823|nr:2-dehydropantoate 2-reductase [Paraburkholderia sp. SOS3]APR40453.1 2-dehydropantoate 2-reductase [Paraburkholderia sp. SOS3]
MKIVVFGTGGVGGYFGARLAQSGCDVTFVARGRHYAAIKAHGLRIESPLGNFTLEAPRIVEHIGAVQQADLVIVAVKLWDTDEAARSLAPLVSRGAAVVSFQNGVQKDETLGKHLPRESIIGGVCYIASVISSPGVITHSGTMQKLVFGEYDGSRSARVQAFHAACEKAGIAAEIADDIERLIWEKYVFLVGLSGTTATIRRPIGAIRTHARTRAFLFDVMHEVVAVGRAKAVRLPADFAENRLAFCDTLPEGMTSSMHHDLENGNRLELPWLSGGVASLGEALNVPTPRNRTIADILELSADGRVSG